MVAATAPEATTTTTAQAVAGEDSSKGGDRTSPVGARKAGATKAGVSKATTALVPLDK